MRAPEFAMTNASRSLSFAQVQMWMHAPSAIQALVKEKKAATLEQDFYGRKRSKNIMVVARDLSKKCKQQSKKGGKKRFQIKNLHARALRKRRGLKDRVDVARKR